MLCTEIQIINQAVFELAGFKLTNIRAESESQDYCAHTFTLNNQCVIFRVAKITPKKIGQFVAIWKRNDLGITKPYQLTDKFDWFLIVTRKNENIGMFIFPKMVLLAHQILSDATNQGKRGIRVYPPWDQTTNKQAQKTQLWQSKYFIDLSTNKLVDIQFIENLLGTKF